MAFTITSNTQSEAELNEVLLARGITPEPGEAVIPDANEKITDPAQASPGESPGGPTGENTPPASETGEKPQEKQEKKAKPEEKKEPPAETPKPEGKFEPRRKQLEKQIARLHEDLDLERGSKAALQAKIDALQADLEKLKPAVAEPVKSSEPVRPKRPTLADVEFDQEAYDKALDKYDDDLTAYHQAVSQKTVNDAIAARDEADRQKAIKAEADRVFDGFVKRRDAEIATIDGYQDAREEAGDYPVPQFVELALIKSKNPARLINFFDRDQIENGGAELARIAALEPPDQLIEMTELAIRLASEVAAGKPVAAPAPAAAVVDAPPPEPKPAAPPKPKATPEAPIEPLGSRASGKTPTLADAGSDFKKYLALRNQGVVR